MTATYAPAMGWLVEEPVRGEYPSLELLSLSGLERMEASFKGLFPKPPIHNLFGLIPESSTVEETTFVIRQARGSRVEPECSFPERLR